jgi:hypothetical protein
VILELSSTRRTASCPLCSRRLHRVHSRSGRTLADRPWATAASLYAFTSAASCVATDAAAAACSQSHDQTWLRLGVDGPRLSTAVCSIWRVLWADRPECGWPGGTVCWLAARVRAFHWTSMSKTSQSSLPTLVGRSGLESSRR